MESSQIRRNESRSGRRGILSHEQTGLAVPFKIHFMCSGKPAAQLALRQLIERYGQNDITKASYVVAIGGDGTALKALHAMLPTAGKPVFAMRLPESVGALGNTFRLSDLPERMRSARSISMRPLKAEVERVTGDIVAVFGINEIVVTRQRLQAAKLHVRTGETETSRKVTGDGLLVATPIGSTGYNRSAGGPILPLGSRLLALTKIAIHEPSDWSNTVLNDQVIIDIEVEDPTYRPVRVETNIHEVLEISRVKISSSYDHALTLLLEDR